MKHLVLHGEFMRRFGNATAFLDSPYDQTLSAPCVPCSEHLPSVRLIAFFVSSDLVLLHMKIESFRQFTLHSFKAYGKENESELPKAFNLHMEQNKIE